MSASRSCKHNFRCHCVIEKLVNTAVIPRIWASLLLHPPQQSRGVISITGGADKSLARPTSRCRRTESIMSLERGVCSCAKLQVFSCYRGGKEACQATRAISTAWRRVCHQVFLPPARQGAQGNSRHSDRNIRGTCTILCHHLKLGGPV